MSACGTVKLVTLNAERLAMTSPSPTTVGVVVVSHGQFATELLNAAEMIVGDLPGFIAVSIGWHDDVTVARDAIERAIAKVDTGRGVLLLTDMFGGTPSNLGLSFLKEGQLEVLTGANLPMLIKLAKTPATGDLAGLAREICEHGRVAIRVASDLLRGDA
jgi:PTS system mannose-specific IIA component